MTTMKLVEELDALAAKATPGEWNGCCPSDDSRSCEAPKLCQKANCCFRDGDDTPLGVDLEALEEFNAAVPKAWPELSRRLRAGEGEKL